MKYAIREVSPVRREIDIEVPASEWDDAVRNALRDVARRAKIPGFRPGKVPADVVKKMFGAGIESEVFDQIVPDRLSRALKESGLVPLSRPVLQDRTLPDGSGRGLSATLTFEVRPRVTIDGYKDLELTRKKPRVDDTAVDTALQELRERAARFVAVDGRAVAEGDYVVVDMTPEHGAKQHNVLVHVRGGAEAKEMDRALVGRTAGDELTVSVVEHHEAGAHDGEHAHEPHDHRRTYRVRILEIKMRELPALDDAFAREVGPYDGLDALRTKLRADLERNAERDVRRLMVRQALDLLLAKNKVTAPEALVSHELEHELRMLADGMQRRGLPVDRVGLDWEALARDMRPGAERNVLLELVFDAIADAEQIPVPQERVKDHIRETAEAARRSPEAVRAQLEKEGQLAVLEASLRREASIDFVLDHARVTSED